MQEGGPRIPNPRDRSRKSEKEQVDHSRRNFLFGATAASAAYIAGPSAWEVGWNTIGKETLEKDIKDLESLLHQRYGIPMQARALEDKSSFGKHTSFEDLRQKSLYMTFKGLETLRDVLALYPPELIKENIHSVQLAYEIHHTARSGEELIANSPDGIELPFQGKILIK